MPNVEFVYEKTCPNVEAARKRLLEAFGIAGVPPVWSEWEVSDPKTPDHLRVWGSPTILVDGCDIAGSSVEESQSCCRIYTLQGNERGIPPLDQIVSALTATPAKETRGLKLNAAVLPSVGAAMLPKLTCPACWPAYAGLLSSFGVGFFDYTPYLMPLTGFFLIVAVLALAYRAAHRRGYGPFALGVAAAGFVMVGKFGFDSDLAMWVGLCALVGASVWNAWPKRRDAAAGEKADCPSCLGANG